MTSPLSKTEYTTIDFADETALEAYAKKLEGRTFQEVLDLGIVAEGVKREYGSKSYKGGMGNLIEERYFGYRANSDDKPDFPEAGVELKVTCYDVKKNGDYSAGERLVITMIPHDRPVEPVFDSSHLWDKCGKILLVYYRRERNIPSYDQQISYVSLFSPSEKDLKIIRDDYDKINSYIESGRADELSESLTQYLGACTKGATAEKSLTTQYYAVELPDGTREHRLAKRRAFCFKRQYMDYVLHHYLMGQTDEAESIVDDAVVLEDMTFEEYVVSIVNKHAGKTDKELCKMLGLKYTGNKAQWTTIVYHLLGINGEHAEEFEKANISVRTVRVEERGKVVESLSLNTFRFKDLVDQDWEDAPLHEYFEETRFFFVAFKSIDGELRLQGAKFWNMPVSDIEGPLKKCWSEAKNTIAGGVKIELVPWGKGTRYENNLPKKNGNPVAHVRPHTSKTAYRLFDGTEVGDVSGDADELPDGRWMTKQSFWLNNDYVYQIVSDL